VDFYKQLSVGWSWPSRPMLKGCYLDWALAPRSERKLLRAYDEKQRHTRSTFRSNLGPGFSRTRSAGQSQKASHPPPSPQRPRTPRPLGASTIPLVHDGGSGLPGLDCRSLKLSRNHDHREPPDRVTDSHTTTRAKHSSDGAPGAMYVHWNEGASDCVASLQRWYLRRRKTLHAH